MTGKIFAYGFNDADEQVVGLISADFLPTLTQYERDNQAELAAQYEEQQAEDEGFIFVPTYDAEPYEEFEDWNMKGMRRAGRHLRSQYGMRVSGRSLLALAQIVR